MDFGLMGTNGSVGQDSTVVSCSGQQLEPKTKTSSPSGSAKNERSVDVVVSADDDLGISKTVAMHQLGNNNNNNSNNHGLRSSTSCSSQSQMLCFSSPKQGVSLPLSYYQVAAAPSVFTRNAGFVYGNMNGSLNGIKGPFTPAQWIELEHQALIYKYLDANVSVPANLLIPIKKALLSSGFAGASPASFISHPYGWGPFHLGLSGGTDPEPGRCRRTDGKKWRCSKDAVPDQKYCERHVNRGRHRSRKPVEGQTGRNISGPINTKVMPPSGLLSSSVSAGVGATGKVADDLVQLNGFMPCTTHPPNSIAERLQDPWGLSVVPPRIPLNLKGSPFSIPKQDTTRVSSQSEFGIVSSDSLLNPSQKSSYLNSSDQPMQNQHPLRHFINDWPMSQADHTSGAWHEGLKQDWTQLSMSIPMSSDFSSSTSSPTTQKAPIQTGLGAGGGCNDSSTMQSSWLPVPWGNRMGGPLAEALNVASSPRGNCKTIPPHCFMLEGWDGGSRTRTSSTDVLHKANYVSLSNSSSGSSPVAENNDLLRSAHASCS